MLSRTRLLVLGMFTAASLATVVSHAAEDKVVATVGDTKITASELAGAERDLGARFAKMPEDRRKVALLETLVDIVLISKLAEADGLGNDAEFIARMKLLRQRALHNIYVVKAVSEKNHRRRSESTLRCRDF